MTPEKAKELLTECLKIGTEEATPDVNDAIRLAIRAIDLCIKYQVSEEFIYDYWE